MRVHRVGICGTDIGGYLGKMPFFQLPAHSRPRARRRGARGRRRRDERQARRPLRRRALHQLPEMLRLPARPHQLLREPQDARRDVRRRPAERIILPARKLHVASQAHARATRAGRDARHRLPRGRSRQSAARRERAHHRRGADRPFRARVRQARRRAAHRHGHRRERGSPSCARRWACRTRSSSRGDESDIKAARQSTNGQLADVVIDATGSNKSMVRSAGVRAFAGRLVYVGITQQKVEFPHAPFLHRRELTIMASRNALAAISPASSSSSRTARSTPSRGSRTTQLRRNARHFPDVAEARDRRDQGGRPRQSMNLLELLEQAGRWLVPGMCGALRSARQRIR